MEFERGLLYADFDGSANSLDTVLWQLEGSVDFEPVFNIVGPAVSSPYLFFEPIDWEFETNLDNDFLVYQVTLRPTRAPEPATLGVLGIGLVALRLLRRRR
jgi:hypothetical protein